MEWTKGAFISEGKGKKLYAVQGQAGLIWLEFKDELTAFNGQKKSFFEGKGKINRDFSSLVFRFLTKENIKTHWVADVGERGMIARCLKIVPLEVVVRNRLTGSTARKFRIAEGKSFSKPLLELYYKNDELKDPFISTEQALAFGFVSTEKDIEMLKEKALLVNEKMKMFFEGTGLELIDFKLELGRPPNKTQDPDTKSRESTTETAEENRPHQEQHDLFVLGDEFSCDTCRLWDKKTGEKQDKDRFRLDLGGVDTAYKKVYESLSQKWKGKI